MGYKSDLILVDAERLVKKFTFVSGTVYKVVDFDFKYVLATDTGDYHICDCFPCNKKGEILKGYEYPVPIHKDNLLGAFFIDA